MNKDAQIDLNEIDALSIGEITYNNLDTFQEYEDTIAKAEDA